MRQTLVAYASGLGCFLALDAVWLSTMGPRWYRPQLAGLMLERFALAPAIAFYLLFGIGLAFFATLPGVQAGRAGHAFALGALFGLVAYATYDLTNLATLKGWPLALSMVDMVWGGLASGVAAAVGARITLWLAA